MLFAAVHESGSVQVFGRRDNETINALRRPASEKRQGTKSRNVSSAGAARAMGIWPRGQAAGSVIAAVAAIGLPQSQGEHVGVNGRASRCVRRFAVRLAASRGGGCELGHGRRRASVSMANSQILANGSRCRRMSSATFSEVHCYHREMVCVGREPRNPSI